MTVEIKERTACRACGHSPFTAVFSLGMIDVIDFGKKERLKAPLDLVMCPKCTLLQLRHTVDQDYLFREYFYKSSVNSSMRDSLRDVVESVMKRVELKRHDTVIDIGANDGTLLSFYPKEELYKVGFDPCEGFAKEMIQNGATSAISGFFSAQSYLSLYNLPSFEVVPTAKVITACSVFYDLDDPGKFLDDVKRVLAPDGLFVIQMNYLPSMLKNNDFTNIVHEHLCFYSEKSLSLLLESHGMFIEDIEFNETNGGSFRVYVRHLDKTKNPVKPCTDKVLETIEREGEMRLDQVQTYKDFAGRVKKIIHSISAFVEDEVVKHKKKFMIYGASTRGATIIELAGLDKLRLIPFAVERNPAKWGTMYLNKIPVISEEMARSNPPDYYLVLPFHFFPEIIEREREFLLRGGKMLIPLPVPHLVSFEKIMIFE